jgi:hypothetical protein
MRLEKYPHSRTFFHTTKFVNRCFKKRKRVFNSLNGRDVFLKDKWTEAFQRIGNETRESQKESLSNDGDSGNAGENRAPLEKYRPTLDRARLIW